MEYSFRLSQLFPAEISVIGSDLIPVGCPILKEVRERVVRERTAEIVNSMGRISAEAQSLSSIVTSADRLHEGDYKLYLYCDFISNKVLGFLKIGKKKLYAFDNSGAQYEMGSMCVLDFHIVNSRQRHGAGKYLFDYMLRNESIPVEHFAFDSPSDQFLFFLKKHYNLTKVFALANNFYIFDGFFTNRDDYSGKREPWHGLSQTSDILHQVAFSKDKESRMKNSRDYNHHEPLIHHGQMRAHYVNPSNVSNFGNTPQFLTQNQHPESQTDEQRRHVTAAGYGHGNTTEQQQRHVSNGDIPHPQQHENMNEGQRRHVSSIGYGYGATQQHHQQHDENKYDGQQGQVNIEDTQQQHHEYNGEKRHYAAGDMPLQHPDNEGQRRHFAAGDSPQPHQEGHEMNEEQRHHVSAAGYGHGDTHQYRQHHTEIKDGGQMQNVITQQEHESKDDEHENDVSLLDTQQPHQQHQEMSKEQRRHVSAAGYGHGDTHQYRQHHTDIKDGGQKGIEVIKEQEHDGQEQQDTPRNHEMNNEQRRLISAVGYGHVKNQLLRQQNNKKVLGKRSTSTRTVRRSMSTTLRT